MIEIFDDIEQGSDSWFLARLGCPTASRFADIMAKGQGKTRRKYMLTLLGERLTGEPAESFSNHHMERGHIHEPDARNLYAFMHDAEPIQVGFIRNGRVGCSPDSLIGDTGLLEIKSKLPALQLEVLLANRLPPEHKAQVQGQLWVAEREWCDFCSYWPGLDLFVTRVPRDDGYIRILKEEVDLFLEEMDELEQKLRNRRAA